MPPSPVPSANLPFTSPSERYRPLTLFSPHHTGAWQHLGRSRVPPSSHSSHPLHENESRERRGKKAPTVGHRGERRERERAIGLSRERARNKKRKENGRARVGDPPDDSTRDDAREGRGNAGSCVSRAPRATHHILLSRLPTLTAGSVPDRPSRMPTTCAGREESHARHPAC